MLRYSQWNTKLPLVPAFAHLGDFTSANIIQGRESQHFVFYMLFKRERKNSFSNTKIPTCKCGSDAISQLIAETCFPEHDAADQFVPDDIYSPVDQHQTETLYDIWEVPVRQLKEVLKECHPSSIRINLQLEILGFLNLKVTQKKLH